MAMGDSCYSHVSLSWQLLSIDHGIKQHHCSWGYRFCYRHAKSAEVMVDSEDKNVNSFKTCFYCLSISYMSFDQTLSSSPSLQILPYLLSLFLPNLVCSKQKQKSHWSNLVLSICTGSRTVFWSVGDSWKPASLMKTGTLLPRRQ